MNSPYSIEINTENFKTEVLEKSKQTPVLLDFWAAWCSPCKTLLPILNKLAEEYAGRFVLAKIDTDQQQALAMHFGVRSLPTVMLVYQGKILDQFMGALPESQVRAFLDRHLPAAKETETDAIERLLTEGDTETARALLQQRLAENPDNADARLSLIEIDIKTGKLDEADAAWNRLPLATQEEDRGKRLRVLLDLARTVKDSDAEATLMTRLQTNPKDSASRYQLAARQALRGAYRDAVENFFYLLQHDRKYQDDAGRKGLVAIFQLCKDKELISHYRRKMSALLL